MNLLKYFTQHVAERTWSSDQKVVQKDEDTVTLTFTAASEPEVARWILGFGSNAKILKPERLVKEIAEEASQILKLYPEI